MRRSIKEADLVTVVFCGCFAMLIVLVMHVTQQKIIMQLQTQVDEIAIEVNALSSK